MTTSLLRMAWVGIVVVAALYVGGAVLERSSSAPSIKAPSFQSIDSSKNNGGENGKGGDDKGKGDKDKDKGKNCGKDEERSSDGKCHKHCDDGKGNDGDKNKKCRPMSGHDDDNDGNHGNGGHDDGNHGDGNHDGNHGRDKE